MPFLFLLKIPANLFENSVMKGRWDRKAREDAKIF
jgi:hypothetical protein